MITLGTLSAEFPITLILIDTLFPPYFTTKIFLRLARRLRIQTQTSML